jgi:hypothetical protein
LPVAFYKEFLGKVNLLIKEMLDEFRARNLDLRRINYGVINLLTKMLDANETKQYRPICLINVIFKIIIKILTRRLFAIVGPYIGPTQTAFIPGRFILDGVVVLDETLDDLKTRIESGIYATMLRFTRILVEYVFEPSFFVSKSIFESLYLSTSLMGRTRYTNPWVPEGHTHVTG